MRNGSPLTGSGSEDSAVKRVPFADYSFPKGVVLLYSYEQDAPSFVEVVIAWNEKRKSYDHFYFDGTSKMPYLVTFRDSSYERNITKR